MIPLDPDTLLALLSAILWVADGFRGRDGLAAAGAAALGATFYSLIGG